MSYLNQYQKLTSHIEAFVAEQDLPAKQQANRDRVFIDAYLQLIHNWSADMVKELLQYMSGPYMKIPLLLFNASYEFEKETFLMVEENQVVSKSMLKNSYFGGMYWKVIRNQKMQIDKYGDALEMKYDAGARVKNIFKNQRAKIALVYLYKCGDVTFFLGTRGMMIQIEDILA